MTDSELLRRYVENNAQEAFSELVGRHVHWINAMAARLTRDRALADDVTQAVFILLARKAGTVRRETLPSTWLFTVTRYCAANAMRHELRRREHERRAAAMLREQANESSQAPEWEELWPMLDEMVGKLGMDDRRIVLLRFYEQKSFPEIGSSLSISEEAARKRLSRAVERLRGQFTRRGVAVGSTALAATLTGNLSHSASAAVAASASAAGHGAMAAPGLAPMIKGTNMMLAWTQLKPVVIVLSIILAAGLTRAILQLAGGAQIVAPNQQAQAPQPTPSAPAPTTQTSMRRGRVVAENDKPVPSARVMLVALNDGKTGHTLAEARTTADGQFELPAIDKGNYVVVQADGYGLTGQSLPHQNLASDPTEIQMDPVTSVRFRLVGPDGKPIAGVRVAPLEAQRRIWTWSLQIPEELKDAMTQTSDANGICVFAGLPQDMDLTVDVKDDRFAHTAGPNWTFTNDQRIALGDTSQTDGGDIHLALPGRVTGRIVIADSGKPVAGVPVHLGPWITITDADGRYSFGQIPAAELGFKVDLSDEMQARYANTAPYSITLFAGQQLEMPDVQLITGAEIHGRVIVNGKPLPHADIWFVRGTQSSTTSEDGTYILCTPPGEQTIVCRMPQDELLNTFEAEVGRKTVTVDTDKPNTVDFELNNVQIITGRVVDPQGHPIAGALITAMAATEDRQAAMSNGIDFAAMGIFAARSNADGNFNLLRYNRDTIVRARKGRWTTVQPTTIRATAGGQITLVMQKDALSSVAMKLQQPDGKPIVGGTVTIMEEIALHMSSHQNKLSDTEGKVVFKSLFPDQMHSVSAWASGYGEGRATVKVQPGKQTELPPIVLAKADSFIAGIVLDENSQPLPDARVEIFGRQTAHQTIHSDATGHFRAEHVIAGEQIDVYTVPGRPERFPAGTSDAVIMRLPPSTRP